jgi:BarA-like signal transduction histidine kinase
MAPPFQKVCGNYCLIDIIISPTSDVYSNACCSKSKAVKSKFLCATIITNKEPMLLTIKGKWLEAIVHMTKLLFLALPQSKQIQLLISIRIHNKFH